jgi:hypothetical protein
MLVHDWPGFHLDDGFRGRWAVAQGTMWSFRVVVLPPLFNQDLRFPQAVEDFPVQQFIPEAGVEALTVSVLPRRTGLDVGRLGADCRNPVPNSLSYKLWAVVRPDVGGDTAQDEQVRQRINDLSRVQLPLHSDRQAFPAVFVQDVERSERFPIMGSVMHEVIRPDMVAIFGPEANTRAIVEPKPSFLRLFHGHFEPLTSPQALNTLVVHQPTCIPQQSRNPTIAVATILAGQLDHVCDQPILISSANGQTSLCGSVLPQDTTNPSFRHPDVTTDVVDASTTTRGAQKFPRAASDSMSLSNVRSDTARRNRSFSF